MIQPYEAHQLLVPNAPAPQHQHEPSFVQPLQEPRETISIVRKKDLRRRRTVIAIVSLLVLTTVALLLWSSRGTLRGLFTRSGKELREMPMATRGAVKLEEEIPSPFMEERGAPLFSFFLLSLSWPGSICLTLRPCNGVTDQTPQVFTIHGLWPQNDPTSIRSARVPPVSIFSSSDRSAPFSSFSFWSSPEDRDSSSDERRFPASCGGKRFNYNLFDDTLKADLRQYWTDFKPDEPQFWYHEWTKHGTCAVKGGVFQDQVDYFGATLKLMKQLPVMDALQSGGIVPSSTQQYTVDQIVDAIEAKIGVRPVLVCNEGRFITEMRFCVDKSLKFFSCPGKSTINCNNSGVILRPIVQ